MVKGTAQKSKEHNQLTPMLRVGEVPGKERRPGCLRETYRRNLLASQCGAARATSVSGCDRRSVHVSVQRLLLSATYGQLFVALRATTAALV